MSSGPLGGGSVSAGGPGGTVRRLHVAGVDILLGRGGRPHVLEVNDRPLHLSRVSVHGGPGRPKAGGGVAGALALDLLASSPAGDTVAVIVPDAFALQESPAVIRHPVAWRQVHSAPPSDDARIPAMLSDLSDFTAAALGAGAAVHVYDGAGLGCGSRESGVPVWNRSQLQLPDHPAVVNTRAAGRVCIDKLATRQLCRHLDPDLPFAVVGSGANRPPADLRGVASLILKPRTGSGSRQLHRGRWPALRAVLDQLGPEEEFLVEPWLEGELVEDRGRSYRFDLRVYVLGGRAVNMLARRAAAPALSPYEDSPLSWLTTTGPVLAVRPSDRPAATVRDDVAAIPRRWLQDAAETAEQAVAAVEAAADDDDRSGPPDPTFRQLHAIVGALRPVLLAPVQLTARRGPT